MIQSLSAKDFKQALKEKDYVLLDVRTPQEFDDGHLEGALLVDLISGEFFEYAEDVDTNKSYALYCRSGNRSKMAIQLLEQKGCQDIIELDGGLLDWTDQGFLLIN